MANAKAQTLKDIKSAIKEFPKVIRQKEAAHKEKEKTIKSFMKVSRALAKSTEKRSRTELLSPTTRFSDRVESYLKYRPSYPHGVIDFFKKDLNLAPGQAVADVGSGTGIFSKLLLQNGYEVFAVEPNKEMREAAEHELMGNSDFHSVAAPAEATTLKDGSVDFVTAATAFHWFDSSKSKREFQRILKPNGLVILLWNARSKHCDSFHEEYETIIQQFGTDYQLVKASDEKLEGIFSSFFSDGKYLHKQFKNHQDFNFDGLCGRLLSSSYAPQKGHPNFKPMMKALRILFDKHAKAGYVKVQYDTEIYVGKV